MKSSEPFYTLTKIGTGAAGHLPHCLAVPGTLARPFGTLQRARDEVRKRRGASAAFRQLFYL
jgi:hypothetical protein